MTNLRTMRQSDWPAVEAIYAAGIAGGNSTFESRTPPSWEAFISSHIPDLCVVAEGGGSAELPILGWVSASPTSARNAYRGVAEVSVYVHPDARGRGVASLLLGELVRRSEELGYWTLQSSTFPENEASIRLQRRHGFRVIGTRERVALMTHGPDAGRWRDTVLLERRRAQD